MDAKTRELILAAAQNLNAKISADENNERFAIKVPLFENKIITVFIEEMVNEAYDEYSGKYIKFFSIVEKLQNQDLVKILTLNTFLVEGAFSIVKIEDEIPYIVIKTTQNIETADLYEIQVKVKEIAIFALAALEKKLYGFS